MSTNGNGRLHMLTDKQASKLGKQNATLDEATEIAQRVAVKVVEHYFAQIPELVGRVVEAALVAYDTSKAEQAVTPGANEHSESPEAVPSESALDTKVSENTGVYPPFVSNRLSTQCLKCGAVDRAVSGCEDCA